jgi:3-keto-L-gulonate-6-phosphate decarboxylase
LLLSCYPPLTWAASLGPSCPRKRTIGTYSDKREVVTKPKLQIALDTMDLARALSVATQTVDIVDRIEVGTPLLRKHGMRAIEAVRARCEDAVVVADCKIMDYGELETTEAIRAGANGVIVQAAAPAETIKAVCLTAQSLGAFTMVDCMGITDIRGVAHDLRDLPLSHLIVHKSKDEQGALGPIQAYEIFDVTTGTGLPPLAVAGGIAPANVAKLVALANIETVIVGRAVVASDAPAEVVRSLLRCMG